MQPGGGVLLDHERSGASGARLGRGLSADLASFVTRRLARDLEVPLAVVFAEAHLVVAVPPPVLC